jgi:hypothetical protein
MVRRVSVPDARRRFEAGQALLVCAYEDEQKWRDAGITGSLSYAQFLTQVPKLPKSQEIIFYCG